MKTFLTALTRPYWDLIKKSKKDIIVFAVILIVMMAVSGLFLRQVSLVHRLSKNLSALEKNQKLNTVLDRLAKELPESNDISQLIGKLAALAKRKHIEDVSITPGQVVKGEIYNEIPMDLTGRTTYHDAAFFLNDIEKLDMLVNIKEIYLEQLEPDVSSIVKLQIKAYTYTLNKEKAKR